MKPLKETNLNATQALWGDLLLTQCTCWCNASTHNRSDTFMGMWNQKLWSGLHRTCTFWPNLNRKEVNSRRGVQLNDCSLYTFNWHSVNSIAVFMTSGIKVSWTSTVVWFHDFSSCLHKCKRNRNATEFDRNWDFSSASTLKAIKILRLTP